jgi:hypothetical protein
VENFEVNQTSREKIIHYYGGLFKKIVFIGSADEVFDLIDGDVRTLLTYSDVGLERIFIGGFNPFKVIIYEEGYATYHPTFAYSLLQKFKYFLKGYAPYIGASAVTSEVIVYNPSVYSRSHGKYACKPVVKFKLNFVQTLTNNQSEFSDIFNYTTPSISEVSSVLLILLGDPANVASFFKGAKKLGEQYDLVIVKGHSYFHDSDDYLKHDGSLNIIFLESSIPAEFVIYDLYKNNIIVDLYHESSTSAIYMKKFVNQCKNLAPDNDFKKEYEKLYCLF